mgnify:CR=1 FL=1|tara:strand:+ start:555 stop:890 length:336 start_codon:yes stop_codon:yes gene_type:complete
MAYNASQIDFGQAGGAFLNDGGEFVAPTGKVIVAINVAGADTRFARIHQSNDIGSNTYHIGTERIPAAVGNGVNAEGVTEDVVFQPQQWIYGRFTIVALGAGAVFLYFGQE